MTILTLAKPEEIELCGQILEEGRLFQRAQGFVQWTEDYPNVTHVREDVRTGKGYVVKIGGEIAGYMCIDFQDDPVYAHIEGAWHSQEPYCVVHRMAYRSKFRGIGLADTVFSLIDQLCLQKGFRWIRVDTDFPNKRMQHIFEKNGFIHCGTIQFEGPKMAYDKKLN